MKVCKARKRHNGVTLVEVVLALALGALILTPVTVVFKNAMDNWDERREHNELIYVARNIMSRMTSDLRYGSSLESPDDCVASCLTININEIAFSTKNLEEDNVEQICYTSGVLELKRHLLIKNGSIYDCDSEQVFSQSMHPNFKIYALDYEYLIGGYWMSPSIVVSSELPGVDAVKIRLELGTQTESSLSLESVVKLRNKI